jgi:YggT family protein
MTVAGTALVLAQDYFGFSVAQLLANSVVYAYYILFGFIIASILFSFFPRYPSNPILQAVYSAVRAVVDPILMPIRNVIPSLKLGGFALDLSPLVAIIGLSIGRSLLLIIIGNFIEPITG